MSDTTATSPQPEIGEAQDDARGRSRHQGGPSEDLVCVTPLEYKHKDATLSVERLLKGLRQQFGERSDQFYVEVSVATSTR